MKRKVCFERFDETRHEAFFDIKNTCQELGISERTYYRWKAAKWVPVWAYNLIKRCTGDLDHFGWKDWKIENGTLYYKQLNHRYYNWQREDILRDLFDLYRAKPRRGQTPNLRIINGGKVNLSTPKQSEDKIKNH